MEGTAGKFERNLEYGSPRRIEFDLFVKTIFSILSTKGAIKSFKNTRGI
jgi:hypothetical protein